MYLVTITYSYESDADYTYNTTSHLIPQLKIFEFIKNEIYKNKDSIIGINVIRVED